MKLVSFGHTEKGEDRKANEDRILVDNKKKLYAVADGVSTPSNGGEAADRAIKFLKKLFKKEIDSALEMVNKKLIEDKIKLPAIGYTTLTVVHIKEKLKIASVGDSPSYLVRKENVIPLNRLDKFFGTTALSQALGEDRVSINYAEYELKNKDVILVATDGVTDVITSSDILKIVKSNGNVKKIVSVMIGLAREKEVVYKDDKSLIAIKVLSEN